MERDEKEGKDFLDKSSAENLDSRDIARKDSVTQNDQKNLIDEMVEKTNMPTQDIEDMAKTLEPKTDAAILKETLERSINNSLSKIESAISTEDSTKFLQTIDNKMRKMILETDTKSDTKLYQDISDKAKQKISDVETKEVQESDCSAPSTQEFTVKLVKQLLQNSNNIDASRSNLARK